MLLLVSRFGSLTRLVLLLSFAIVSCAANGAEEEFVACALTGITASVSHSEYLRLSTAQELSVVAVEYRRNGLTSLCSGVLVAPHVVITALHCVDKVDEIFVLVGASVSGAVRYDVVEKERRESSDLAFLHTNQEVSGAQPIAVAVGGGVDVGTYVELAGYGGNGVEGVGNRRFAVARVDSVLGDAILTSRGDGGPCSGDSGGPMLSRLPTGAVTVVGVLRRGPLDCRGGDEYVNVALGTFERPEELPAPCDSIGAPGGCFSGTAVWCEEGRLVHEACTNGRICGWRREVGFRCVAAENDQCLGVSEFATCDGSTRTFCENGDVRRVPCPCGTNCRISLANGGAECSTSGS